MLDVYEGATLSHRSFVRASCSRKGQAPNMPKKQVFRFVSSARLQHFLGNQLIADPNLAIIEFVKNAYDAGAAHLNLDFRISDPDRTTLVIADDGTGMDEDSFEENWMRPGFSAKSPDAPARSRRSSRSAAAKRQAGRIPAGEKGIGRLAAGRLGQSLEVFTRTRTNAPWLHVFFDWRCFSDMTKSLQDVEISYDFDTRPDSPLVQSGTILSIRDLSQRWDARVPGRPVAGRSRTRLGRLRQDLELLVRPLTASSNVDFTIYLESDSLLETDDVGTIAPHSAVRATDYRYSFELRVDSKGRVQVHGELHRSEAIREQLGGPLHERFKAKVITPTIAKDEGRPDSLECGPFRGVFLYTPPPAAHRARTIDAVGNGVLLYRDGILVEPYGLGNDDWIGVAARKAQRQGHALIQPITFSGHVLISRSENPNLRDMSNRQGLIEDQASEAFVSHVRAEFAFFESQIFKELSARWTAKEEKASRKAADVIEGSDVRLRAVAHSLGQPLLGLSAEIAALKAIAQGRDVPDAIRPHLLAIAASAEAHVALSQTILRRLLDVRPVSRTAVNVPQLVAAIVQEVEALADSLDVRIEVDQLPSQNVLVARELVFEAVKEIVRNGIQAARPAGRPGVLRIAHHEDMGDLVLDVIDNGTGIPGAKPDHPVGLIASTKGQPGEGLVSAELSMSVSLGRIRIASTGQEGTHFEIYLPDLISGLRGDR